LTLVSSPEDERTVKPVVWIGSSKDDISELPTEVKLVFGQALYLAQIGRKHPDAKPLTGIGGGVLEVVEDFNKNTYRAVYKVQLGDVVYVLHVFQKKSKSGKATPKPDLDLIKSRLKLAKQDHERRTKAKGKP
jgi:phage-related protein